MLAIVLLSNQFQIEGTCLVWYFCDSYVNIRILWRIFLFPRCKIIYVYLGFGGGGRPTQEFFTHSERSPLPVKGYKIWPIIYSALMAIELWRFFNVPRLLWLWISDTHNVVERWQWSCHYLFYRLGIEPRSPACDEAHTSCTMRILLTTFAVLSPNHTHDFSWGFLYQFLSFICVHCVVHEIQLSNNGIKEMLTRWLHVAWCMIG